MQYRVLGKTGLTVSALALGGSPLGGVFGQVEERDAIATVHAALDAGVNFIDTSPYYALTKSETVLGRALRGVARDRYFLATKVGRYGAAEFDFSAARVKASVDESLQRLGVDYVDVIQCHDIEYGSLDQVIEETIPALREVQRAGKARYVGITGLPLHIFETVLARAEVDTILSYCRYSLNDTGLERILPMLEAKSVGIIHAAPLAMGLLTDSGPPAWHPASREIQEACARAAAHCEQRGRSLARLAMQFALANPRLHTVIAGMSSVAEVQSNVECLSEPLDEELLHEVLTILAPIHNQTWATGDSLLA